MMRLSDGSVIQSAPSGPVVIVKPITALNRVTVPVVLILPTQFALWPKFVNHNAGRRARS